MNNKTTHTSTGISFCTALTLIFVVLKLTNLIQWSWVWVFSPLWIGFMVFIGFLMLGVLILSICRIVETIEAAKKNKENNKN